MRGWYGSVLSDRSGRVGTEGLSPKGMHLHTRNGPSKLLIIVPCEQLTRHPQVIIQYVIVSLELKYQLHPIPILTIWQVMVEPFKHFHNACRQYVYRDVVNKGCELNQHFESGRLYRHIRESPLLS